MGTHRPYCDYDKGEVCWCPQGLIEQVYGKKKDLGASATSASSGVQFAGPIMPTGGRVPTSKRLPHKPKTSGNVAYGGNSDCVGDRWNMTIEPFYGVRSWKRDKYGRLVSPQQEFLWKPGVNTADGDIAYGAGFFSYHDKPHPTWEGKVKGIVKCTGKVTVGSRGMTAEKAEIVAYYEPKRPEVNRLQRLRMSTALKFGVADRDTMSGSQWRKKYPKYTYKSELDTFLAMIGGALLVLGLVFGLAVLFSGAAPWGVAALLLALSPVGAFLTSLYTVTEKKARGVLENAAPDGVPSIEQLYPGVQKFDNLDKMLKAFPLGPPTPPEPEIPAFDSEDFWNLPIKGV